MAKAKPRKRSKLVAAVERLGKTLGRAAGRIDRWRGKPPVARKTKRQPSTPIAGRRGSKAHLRTEATMRHDASAVAKAEHASERPAQKPRYRNQSR